MQSVNQGERHINFPLKIEVDVLGKFPLSECIMKTEQDMQQNFLHFPLEIIGVLFQEEESSGWKPETCSVVLLHVRSLKPNSDTNHNDYLWCLFVHTISCYSKTHC